MIYFTVKSNEVVTEGIGATFQYQIVCYILSKLYGVEYYFEGAKNLHHYQYFNVTNEKWCSDTNNFFNLTTDIVNLPKIDFNKIDNFDEFISKNSDVIVEFSQSQLMQFLDNELENIDISLILDEIRQRIQFSDELKYFKNDVCNMALHIRKYTQTDSDPNPRRELFSEYRIPYYQNLINNIKKLKSDFILHVYSQGTEDEFKFLKEYGATFHIEENPLVSIYHMIYSDIFITSNSSLSFISHLLGKQKVRFCRNTFFHKWRKENTIFLDDGGNFDNNKFLQLIK